ncbi:hypothetical protein KUTeg_002634 [Tegillarca granosa]|uniref:Death domain-containing protein n=1 Tax=Tegillarca granosa TaxID=220873 RepID=A0ABQ9FW79_TEGGR|nr:hypothetical protein KUTeg_002634 [Tegillarca granosa]
MYSDKKDNIQRCIQLTFCEKDGRCTLKKSNGTFDNVCSGKVAVFSASFREIEDRINNQIWSLAQKLYKDHYQAGMYELIVEKYKGKENKFAINGYLEEWRQWKGETPQAISDIFRSLKECSREDIVYEICNKFREGYPEVVLDAEGQLENGVVRKRSSNLNFFERNFGTFPLCKKKRNNDDVEKQENRETKDKLLALEIQSREPEQEIGNLTPQEAGVIFRDRPSPSAPVIDEFGNVHTDVGFHRTLSSPVQCSS